jgi:hydroxymethylglutaryl-CoA lyase
MKHGTIRITEVGPRDGLQNEKVKISTEDKLHYIALLKDSGLKRIESTSFVRPEVIPALADSEEVSSGLSSFENVEFIALVPNLKGYEKVIKYNYKEIAVFSAASESFTKKNINKTIEESLVAFKEVTDRARLDHIQVRGYISTVIACPYEGKIAPEKVLEVCKKLEDLGVYEISLGETIGVASPSEVGELLELLLKYYSPAFFSGHFHDTYGTALLNTYTAIKMGIRSFDSSSGGLGGCPYAPGAAGNLATEDLIYFLEKEGYETGVDLNKLVLASKFMEEKIGRKLMSKAYQAHRAKWKI